VHAEAVRDFETIFGRHYEALEGHRLDDSEYVLVMIGSFATKGKAAVDRWRDEGRRVGLLRLRLVRPQPTAEIVAALAGRKAVAVIDQSLSPGLGGILFHELAGALVNCPNRPRLVSFVGGLGGKDISQAEFDHVLSTLETPDLSATSAGPNLLFTEEDWEMTLGRLTAAGKRADRAVESSVMPHNHPPAAPLDAEEVPR
jgi:pyruvate ferredoxin oxidoreductase alpha subunit